MKLKPHKGVFVQPSCIVRISRNPRTIGGRIINKAIEVYNIRGMFDQVLGSMLDDPAAAPGSSKEKEEEGDSYEELVMKRVAAYVQQSHVRCYVML